MKSLIEIVKKYKLQILFFFLLIFIFRSCGKSRDLRKSEKIVEVQELIIDSLSNVISEQKNVIKSEKLKIHMYYDNWIAEKNRSPQLMELHMIVKDNIKKEQQNK
jgi:AAA+ ATPase superfamily predicted ATPase